MTPTTKPEQLRAELPDDDANRAALRTRSLESALRGVLLVIDAYRKMAIHYAEAYARVTNQDLEFEDYTGSVGEAIDLANKVLEQDDVKEIEGEKGKD